MQLIETNLAQRGLLPLPASSLVIDMRGVNDDEVIERLNIEMADLASEMKTYNVYHWRYLTDFLSFMRVQPSSAFEERRHAQPPLRSEYEPADYQFEDDEKLGPMGPVHPVGSGSSIFFQDDQSEYVSGDMPFDLFEQKVDELTQEINRIRNNRIAAVADLNKAGIPGRSLRDATVRVIFLTDAERPESLKSAAIYAERIKDYYRKRERPNHQPLVSTTILCLGNSGEIGPPRKLIEGLMRNNSWDHLDTLILSEDYREDAALIAGTVQAYIAELLLYVLLIIPPFGVNAPAPEMRLPDDGQEPGRWVTLPPNTFIVGLAALEYSARWGRRWLSYGLAKDAAEVLTQRPFDEVMERRRIDGSVEAWFNDWRSRVQHSVPDHIPAEVSALEGVLNARRVANPGASIFIMRRFSLHIGESTVKDLHEYKNKLVSTYVATTSDPTLQESVLRSTPQIMHTLQQSESKTLAERKVSEIAALQIEAEQILSRKNFFAGATGALSRARTQLEALGKLAGEFQNDHQRNSLNPVLAKEELKDRCDKLEKKGDAMIEGLQKHLDSWPLFGAFLKLRVPMAILSIALLILVIVVGVMLGFAWLNHLLVAKGIGFVSYLDAPILGMPTLELIGWGLVVTLGIIGVIFERALFGYKALKTEVIFLVLLIASALFGMLVAYSISALSSSILDPVSIDFLTPLAAVPDYARFAFALAIVIIVLEALYFGWWLTHLRHEREDIVQALHAQHGRDVTDVTNYIADDVALEILKRAELVSADGNLGEYYFRVDRLRSLLEEVVKKTQMQQELAGKRLLLSQSETQEGLSMVNGSTWLNLYIRDEKLETEVLTDGYKELRRRLMTENETLREFAEFLLRNTGVEKPVEIGQSLEGRQTRINGEPRRLQILMSSLVSTTLRFSVDPLSVNSINPILDQYKSTNEYALQHMPTLSSLIQVLSKKMSQATLRSLTNKNAVGQQRLGPDSFQIAMSTDAVATWSQMFWQNKNHAIDEALTQDGVLAQLMRLLGRDYDPRAVMRRLLARTSLFGRSIDANRYGELYLLLAPSTQSYEFRQGLKSLKLPRIIDFPDVERMLLLGVQHYVAPPLFLPERANEAPRSTTNGLSMLDSSFTEEDEIVVPSASDGMKGYGNGNGYSNGNGFAHSNGATPSGQHDLDDAMAADGTDGVAEDLAAAPTVVMAPSQTDAASAPAAPIDPAKVVEAAPPLDPAVPMNSSLSKDTGDKEDEEDSVAHVDSDQSNQHNTAPVHPSSEDKSEQ